MLYLILCRDAADAGPLRQANRPAHLDYLKAAGDRLKTAGPLLDDAGETPVGSVLVLAADNLAAAEAWAAGDPFATLGVFASREVRPFKWSVDNTGGAWGG